MNVKHSDVMKLLRLVQRVQEADKDMPVTQLAAFFGVALYGEEGAMAVGRSIGQPRASISRNIRRLTDQATPSREGYGLVRQIDHPKDFRRKQLVLTDDGEALLRDLCEIVGS